MKIEKVTVQLGNGSKVHVAQRWERNGHLITAISCGSKSVRGLTVLELAGQEDRFDYCDKCDARGLVK
jgi:hypothetical protein